MTEHLARHVTAPRQEVLFPVVGAGNPVDPLAASAPPAALPAQLTACLAPITPTATELARITDQVERLPLRPAEASQRRQPGSGPGGSTWLSLSYSRWPTWRPSAASGAHAASLMTRSQRSMPPRRAPAGQVDLQRNPGAHVAPTETPAHEHPAPHTNRPAVAAPASRGAQIAAGVHRDRALIRMAAAATTGGIEVWPWADPHQNMPHGLPALMQDLAR